MRKLYKKLGLISLIIVIPTLFSFIATVFFPEYFTIGNYGIVEVQNEYEEKDSTYNEILILGDSMAQASYIPLDLTDSAYNFSLGGQTPIDGYYRLLDYLENHNPPEYLFCSYNPSEFSSQKMIWESIIMLNGIPLDISLKIMNDARNYDEPDLNKENSAFQAFACHYGVYPECVIRNIKGLIYNIFQGSCYEQYLEQREWVIENRGQWPNHAKGGKSDDVTHFPALEDGSFFSTEMAEAYLRRIIELCEEKGTLFIYETVPLNESTYNNLESSYIESYEGFWKKVSREYPNAVIRKDIYYYSNEFFSDNAHLNLNGAKKFTNYIKEKYNYIFEVKN